MKILCIGGGSMGRRRLRDLTYLLSPDNVILFEPVEGRCKEVSEAFGVRGFTNLEEALAQEPEAVIVSTPPVFHEQYVHMAIKLNLHVFSEVPFVLDVKGLTKIVEEAPSYSGVLGISHTTRYYPPFRIIKDFLSRGAIGQPLYIEYSLGNYLPDWHPYEDYRKFYASDIRLGGAGMDMILHELGPIQWWLGEIESVYARFSKLSQLEISGPDNHDILISFADGAKGFLHHDLIERGTVGRHVRIVGAEGTLEWHQNQPFVRVYERGQNRELPFEEASDWDAALKASAEMIEILTRQRFTAGRIPSAGPISFTYESCYLREMRHFLDAVSKKAPYTMASIHEELQTVKTFHAIVQSSEEKREVKVNEVEVH